MLIWLVVIAAVLIAVFAAAEFVEHIPRKRGEDPRSTAEPDAAVDILDGNDELFLAADAAPEGAVSADSVASAVNIDGSYDPNIKHIVVIGVDKQELAESPYYRTGGQSDVVLIVSMNLKTKTYSILSINRDLAVPVENYASNGGTYGVVEEQLALAYGYGDGSRESGRNVLKSLHWLLGDEIDFLGFIAAPIPIIGKLADAVGGVEVTIEDDFTGVDDTLIQGETINLTGEHAEHFVRARMTMKESNTNALRMGRQIQFMEAFMKKAKSTMSAKQVVNLYTDVLDMCVTDMGKADITKWIMATYDYEFTGFRRLDGVEGERKNGARCTYETPENVEALVKELYYKH